MITVIGYEGRVGNFLYKAYQRAGIETFGIGRRFEYSSDNLLSINGLVGTGPHCIVYTALSSDRPYTSIQSESDLNALRRFLEWAGRLNARPRLVFLSSISVYENLPAGSTETGIELVCESPYSQMKLGSENLIKKFRGNFERVEILRCGALLVHFSTDESFIGKLITALTAGQHYELVNPKNRFNALITAADLFGVLNNLDVMQEREDFVSTFNIGSTDPLTMFQLAEHIANRLHVKNSVRWREDSSIGERLLQYPLGLSGRLPTVMESLDRYTSQLTGFGGR